MSKAETRSPSTQGIIKTEELKKRPMPKMPDMPEEALHVWGILRDIERQNEVIEL